MDLIDLTVWDWSLGTGMPQDNRLRGRETDRSQKLSLSSHLITIHLANAGTMAGQTKTNMTHNHVVLHTMNLTHGRETFGPSPTVARERLSAERHNFLLKTIQLDVRFLWIPSDDIISPLLHVLLLVLGTHAQSSCKNCMSGST